MRRALNRLALATGLAAAVLPVAAQDAAQHGVQARCISGNCHSGFGTLARPGGQFTGPWLNGRFVDAVYEVRWTADPAQATQVRINAEGQFVEGTQLRGGAQDYRKAVTRYTGTFAPVWNPFVKQAVSGFRTGRYEDHMGRIFEGEFLYMPSRLAGDGALLGVFVMQGVRIDPVEDEVLPGLFVSDVTPPGLNIEFHRARPDYLAKLQADYLRDQAQSEREQASQEQMQGVFRLLLGFTMVGANMVQGGGLGGGGGGSGSRLALDLLAQVIQGQQKADAALDRMSADMQRRIAAQPRLEQQLQLGGVTTSREVAQKVAQSLLAQPRRMTVKEYEALLREAGR